MQIVDITAKPLAGTQNVDGGIPWASVIQFALSGLAVTGLWMMGLVLLVMGLSQQLAPAVVAGNGNPGDDPLAALLMASGLLFSGALLLPSMFYAFLSVIGRPAPGGDGRSESTSPWRVFSPAWLILLLPLVVLLGHGITRLPGLTWLLLPPVHLLAVALPVAWLLYEALRKLPVGSAQRSWGVFGSGLVLGPLIIIVVEILSLLTTFAMAVIFVSTQSSLVSQMSDLAARLTPLRDSPEALVRVLGPYMAQPAVVLVALFFGAVIIPLIEELIKPIGVWLIARQDLTPAAGFAAGALSGAGYALFESLALGSSGGDSWAALVVARMGTGVIHILNTSLMGWALASAWSQRRYLRLGVTYLITAMIHGIWNGMTILNVYAELLTRVTQMAAQDQPGALTLLAVRVGNAAPAVLGLLTFGGVVLLLSCNRSLRDHSQL